MSKAFTSEETPDDPIVVPPRAPLPPGVPNFVTARGLAQLRSELGDLDHERTVLTRAADDPERTRRLAVNAARIAALAGRIASAQLVDPREQAQDDVRFGASVDLRAEDGTRHRYRIVGVDEADPANGRIAFLAPMARALLGLRIGDVATLHTASGERTFDVEGISYEPT